MSQKGHRYNRETNETIPRYEKTRSRYDESLMADMKDRFLIAFQWGAGVGEAARFAGIHKATLYRWRKEDPDFADAWRQSRNDLVNQVELHVFKRALAGNDRLLMFILKSYKPDIFHQRQHQPKPSKSRAVGLLELAEKVREWV